MDRISPTNDENIIQIVHMKPKLQEWNAVNSEWTSQIGGYLNNNLDLYIGNYKQSGIFHYTEHNFFKKEYVNKYKNKLQIECT